MSRCLAITKRGSVCKAPPLAGTDHCISHAPKELQGSLGFGGPQPGSGRPPAPRAVDVLRERVEADIDRVLAPLFDALTATDGVTIKVDGEVEFFETPDHTIRLAAVRELLDRAYGKAKQATEVTGADGGPVVGFDPKRLSDDELRQVVSIVGRGRGDSAAA